MNLFNPEQLKALRRHRGKERNRLRAAMDLAEPRVTQEKLAVHLEMTQPQISRLVRGDYVDVSVAVAGALAEFFGCSIEDLFPAEQKVAS